MTSGGFPSCGLFGHFCARSSRQHSHPRGGGKSKSGIFPRFSSKACYIYNSKSPVKTFFNLNFAQHSCLNSLRENCKYCEFSPVCLFELVRQSAKGSLTLTTSKSLGEVCLCSASLGGGEKLGCLFFLAVFGKWLTDFGHGREYNGPGRRQTKPYLE